MRHPIEIHFAVRCEGGTTVRDHTAWIEPAEPITDGNKMYDVVGYAWYQDGLDDRMRPHVQRLYGSDAHILGFWIRANDVDESAYAYPYPIEFVSDQAEMYEDLMWELQRCHLLGITPSTPGGQIVGVNEITDGLRVVAEKNTDGTLGLRIQLDASADDFTHELEDGIEKAIREDHPETPVYDLRPSATKEWN